MITQVCAWCQREGIQTILAWGDEPGESHGCCEWHGVELVAEGTNLSLAKRFLAHVDHSGDCWLWTGRVNSKGYGVFDMKAEGERRHRPELAHRVMWWLTRGEYVQQGRAIPHPHCILHECDVPNCVRPAHLECGTDHPKQPRCWREGKVLNNPHDGLAASESNRKWWGRLTPQERKDEVRRRRAK